MEKDTFRLNKYLAHAYGCSRRKADEYIENKQVCVNGLTANLGMHITANDIVTLNGNPVQPRTTHQTIIMHKPCGYVCSRKQQGDIPTIYSLLPEKLHALKTVGRLDANSSGVILLTSDGDLAHTMTHPSFQKQKIYEIKLDKELEPLHQQMIADFGVSLSDGISKLGLTRLSETDRSVWQITMSEGRNRQIRRTFLSLGYTVIRLHRTHFGIYALNTLAKGKYKDISETITSN